MIDAQPISDETLLSLAAAREERVRQAIVGTNAELGTRVASEAPATVDLDDNERIRMKLTLRGQ